MEPLNLSIVILTSNEEIHIERLLKNIAPIAKSIYIIDSLSTDRTLEIAQEFKNIYCIQHEWPGNQATQFNWALDNIDIKTKWIMRLDADEYLSQDLIDRLRRDLPSLPEEVSAISLRLQHNFLGKKLKGGTGNVYITRIFRNGKAAYEERLMDERFVVFEGETVRWDEPFVDDNLNDLTWWTTKHNGYATREAMALLDEEFGLSNLELDSSSKSNKKKSIYLRLPLFWRSFSYFIYRYFFRGGFLEGKRGFIWCFLQGWWYRTLVDAKIYEVKKKCGNNPEKIRTYFKEKYNL